MIVTDDQRWDTLAYMPTVHTELVGKGVTFTNAFAVNPVCCPSRASILTGRWSHSTGVWSIAGAHGGFAKFADTSTLPVWLDRAGYDTLLVGKYLNGYLDASYVPPGWDHWYGNTTNPNGYFGWAVSEDGVERVFGTEPGDYATDVLADRAIRFITEASSPFFLYLAPKAPHVPATPAPRHVGRLAGLPRHRPPNWNENDVSDKPSYIRSLAKIPADELAVLRQKQLESLLALDEAVAQLLGALADTGKLADTLIIFTSDNGFAWGEHRRQHKIVPYEESIRVPLVVRWDALGAPPRSIKAPTLNVDLAQTITAAAGVSAPRAEGRDLLPLITGTASSWRKRFLIESYMGPKWGVPAYCGFRGPRWKYVQYATGEEELYELATDPYELHNLAPNRRRVIRAYRRLVRESPCRPPGSRPL